MKRKNQAKSEAQAPKTLKYQPKHPIRIITAASLFDGHDAAINIMRRILQSTGAEVVHLGHNRRAEDIVNAAIQEDAQAIALSSYQGGHVEYFKYIIDLLKKKGAAHIKVFGGGGGTITPKEIAQLEKYGVQKIFSPEDGRTLGLQGIINDILKSSDTHPLKNIKWNQLDKKAPGALAQQITCLEWEADFLKEFNKHRSQLTAVKKLSTSAPTSATVVGITGTGGAGKSSLTDELILRILESNSSDRIAVIAIDPTRLKTGGALLGDRLRMNSLHSGRCFMRSLATRQANQSVSQVTKNAVGLLRAHRFDWIFVETGGIGQSEVPIADFVDINLYVMTSEYGASSQLEKINMLDFADMVIINKFEKHGSMDALLDVRKQFRRNHREFEKLDVNQYPILGTVASRFGDAGVTAAFEHLNLIRGAKIKRCPMKLAFDTKQLDTTPIVPANKISYLSSIAEEVRQYKQRVVETTHQLQISDSCRHLENLKFDSATKTHLKRTSEEIVSKLPPDFKASIESFKATRLAYQGDELVFKVRGHELREPLVTESLSQRTIRRVSVPPLTQDADILKYAALENIPGHFPFTAGVYPLKRLNEEPKRMFAGEGTPSRTNKRFHYLCKGEPSQRLSTAFDSVTLYGEDPDKRPDIYGKIGESGVSVCTLDDAKQLYAGFDLCDPQVSVSMTINGPAPIILAFFFNTAIDQQLDKFTHLKKRKPTAMERSEIEARTLSSVRGTVQADILKEDQAQNTCIFSTEFALKMMGDVQQYFIDKNIRNFYSISISGYHIAEAGANPISQLAFTLANGFTFVEYYLSRGMKIDDFAPNLSFFFSNGLDPEYTVIGRVARRIWAIAMKYAYEANERSQKLKYHIQTSGRSLHAQEIAFNDIRTTLQAFLAYSDHCNSLHTNAYDEAITTPTEESVRRAMAIQLILAREFGVNKNENPLQGSYFIEELTDMVEEAVLDEFVKLSLRGGVLGAMEHQYQRNRIQEESLYYEHKKHSGEFPIVGVNTFTNPNEDYEGSFSKQLTRASYSEKDEQIRHLNSFHKKNAKLAPPALAKLKEVAKSGGNVFAELMSCARVASLGQISHALYEIGGEYRRSS